MPISDYSITDIQNEIARRAALPRNNRIFGYRDNNGRMNWFKIKANFLAAIQTIVNDAGETDVHIQLTVSYMDDENYALNPDQWIE